MRSDYLSNHLSRVAVRKPNSTGESFCKKEKQIQIKRGIKEKTHPYSQKVSTFPANNQV